MDVARDGPIPHVQLGRYVRFERSQIDDGLATLRAETAAAGQLTTVVGTTIFTELGKSTGTAAKITVGVIAALAAVLAAVKEQAAFEKSSADHEAAGAKYGALHHHVQEKILDYEREAPSQGGPTGASKTGRGLSQAGVVQSWYKPARRNVGRKSERPRFRGL